MKLNCNCKTKGILKNTLSLGLAGIGFLVLPKCPMCIAGWVAAISGIMLSFQVAYNLKIATLIIASLGGLTFLLGLSRRLWLRFARF